jgi:hypothetical protein
MKRIWRIRDVKAQKLRFVAAAEATTTFQDPIAGKRSKKKQKRLL